MKRLAFFTPVLAFLLLVNSAAAQQKEMFYTVEVKHFFDGEGNPYIELMTSVDGTTIHHSANQQGKFTSELGIAMEIRNEESDAATADYANKFVLAGPALNDTTAASLTYSLTDVRRIKLSPGKFVLTGYLFDRNDPSHKENKFTPEIVVDAASLTSVTISDISFLRSFKPTVKEQTFSKHGYDPEPLVTNSAFVDRDSLLMYAEVYNSAQFIQGHYFASIYVTRANSSTPMEGYKKTIKVVAGKLDLLNAGFDIRQLPSETYYLNVDVYNRQNEVVASRNEKFYVSNSRVEQPTLLVSNDEWQYFNLTEQQLDYFIPTLSYISNNAERHFAKALTTFEDKKNFFFNIWNKRKENPADPAVRAWKQYEATIQYVNQHYKAVYKEGWRTDRGRVMMMYGPPNDVEQKLNENDRYPSEIWKYNRLGAQSNVTFIFYDPDGITGDWPLLHSDKIGESPNPRWKIDLVRRSANDANMDNDNFDGPNTHPFRD